MGLRVFFLALAVAAAAAAVDSDDIDASNDDRVPPRVLTPLPAGGLAEVAAARGATLLALHAGDCAVQLDDLNEVVSHWGTLLTAHSVDVGGKDGAAIGKEFGVSARALPACSLHITGAPAGEAKPDADEWPAYGKLVQNATQENRPLQKWAFSLFPAAAAIVTTPAELAALATGPTGPRPVALLFSEGGDGAPPPLLDALAWQVQGYAVAHAPVASSPALVAEFKLTKFPAFALAFAPPEAMRERLEKARAMEGGGSGGGTPPPPRGGLAVQPFGGPLKFVVLRAWLQLAAREIGVPGSGGGDGGDGAPVSRGLADPTAPPLDVPLVTTQAALAALCPASRRALCVLAPVASLASPAAVALRSVAGAWTAQPVVFGALDSTRRGGAVLAASLGDGASPPAALVYSPSKLRGVALEGGEVTEAGLTDLLERVFSGAARTLELAALPDVEAAAVGSDAAAEAAEDEFDLKDVLAVDVGGGGARGRRDREEL